MWGLPRQFQARRSPDVACAVRRRDVDGRARRAPAPRGRAGRQRRAADAPSLPGGANVACPMYCLVCGYDVFEVQRDVCPTCANQDCLVPLGCALAVRCKRSGRDSLNVPIYSASTQDLISKRLANIVLRNAKRISEHTWLRDPRDTQGEGPRARQVGFAAGSTELRFGSFVPRLPSSVGPAVPGVEE